MVLKTRSCSLLTTLRSSSPSEAMALVVYVVFCSQRRRLGCGRTTSKKSRSC
jgi:hypothetical protein